MNIDDIKKGVKAAQIVFSIDRTSEDLEMYSSIVLRRLVANNVTLKEFNNAIAKFIDVTEVSYNKLPTVAELLKYCNKRSKSVEEMAEEEASNAFSCGTSLKMQFAHPVTNYVVQNRCGGLDNFIQEYLCKYKDDKSAITWKRKDFVREWIMCYDQGLYSDDVLSCGGYIPSTESVYLVESTHPVETLMIESSNNKKSLDIVKQLGNDLKMR